MAGVRVRGPVMVDRDGEAGHKHAGTQDPAQDLIHVCQERPAVIVAQQPRPEGGLHHPQDDARGHAVPDDVRDAANCELANTPTGASTKKIAA